MNNYYSATKRLVFTLRCADFALQLVNNGFTALNFSSLNHLLHEGLQRTFKTWKDLEDWYKSCICSTLSP